MKNNQNIIGSEFFDFDQEGLCEAIQDIVFSRLDDLKDSQEVFQIELDNFPKKEARPNLQYYQVLEDTLPDIFRKSHFIMIFSTFEQNIFAICKFLKNLQNIKMSVSDLKGKGIEQSKNYLEKIVGIKFKNEEWSKIVLYRDIRNYIIHSESVCWDNENNDRFKKLFNKIDKTEHITVYNKYCLQLSSKFLEVFLMNVYEFSYNIFMEIKKTILTRPKQMGKGHL